CSNYKKPRHNKASCKDPVVGQTPKPKGVLGRLRKKQSVDDVEDVDVVLRGPVKDEGDGGSRGGVGGSRGGASVSRGGASVSRGGAGGSRGGAGFLHLVSSMLLVGVVLVVALGPEFILGFAPLESSLSQLVLVSASL
nr:hypothetical protein [Tanacetum cinerariifolium]